MLMTKYDELVKVTTYSTQAREEQSDYYSERSWNDGEDHTVKIFGRPKGSVSEHRNGISETSLILHNGEFLESGIGPDSANGYIELSAKDVRRWDLASKELGKGEKMSKDEDTDKDEQMGEDQEIGKTNQAGKFGKEEENRNNSRASEQTLHQKRSLSKRISQIQGIYLGTLAKRSRNAKANSKLSYLSSLGILPIIYGGIHLAAWNFDFPSQVESLLWKFSSFIIIGLAPVLFLLLLLSLAFEEYPTDWLFSSVIKWFTILSFISLLSLVFLGSLLYTFARIFLVVESFISLRHVPIGVYAAVPWVQNIPHV